jgi:hypothetical protein
MRMESNCLYFILPIIAGSSIQAGMSIYLKKLNKRIPAEIDPGGFFYSIARKIKSSLFFYIPPLRPR